MSEKSVDAIIFRYLYRLYRFYSLLSKILLITTYKLNSYIINYIPRYFYNLALFSQEVSILYKLLNFVFNYNQFMQNNNYFFLTEQFKKMVGNASTKVTIITVLLQWRHFRF